MPRGWLKNESRLIVGNKKQRGGSSSPQNKQSKRTPKNRHRKNFIPTNILQFDDPYLFKNHRMIHGKKKEKEIIREQKQPDIRGEIGECSVCWEIAPLVPLFKSCNHAPQCRSCLRNLYVKRAQEDVSNYPLRCYHPYCKRPIHEAQLISHGLLYSNQELVKHHRLIALSKAHRCDKNVAYCPECDFPRVVNKEESVTCLQCEVRFILIHQDISTWMSTIAAIESSETDGSDLDDEWACCPYCNMIVSKDGGDDEIFCVCGNYFDWGAALRRKNRQQKLKKSYVVYPSRK